MADPLTILGAAASITTLIEVLSKTVITLHSLHTRYSSADFTSQREATAICGSDPRFRDLVKHNVLNLIRSVVAVVDQHYPSKDQVIESQTEILRREIDNIQTSGWISLDTANVLLAFWEEENTGMLILEALAGGKRKLFMFFVENLQRLTQLGYHPTCADLEEVEKLIAGKNGFEECKINHGTLEFLVVNPGPYRSERRKWIDQFDNTTSIIFLVDLSQYAQTFTGEPSQNEVTEELIGFDSVCNSPRFMRSSIILFLCGIETFRQKLATIPLSDYFQAYTDGPDLNKATKYILWRFCQLNRTQMAMYPYLCEASDPGNLQTVHRGCTGDLYPQRTTRFGRCSQIHVNLPLGQYHVNCTS